MNTQTPDNEVARLKEQNQNIRDAYLKSVERDDFITQENARLRELLNRAIDYTKNALFFARTYDNKIQWNEIDKLWEKIRDLEKETLTPTTEEPVTQEESSDAVRYADYILNHYDRNSEKDKLCLAKNLLRHGWNNGQPTALAPEEQTLCLREPTAEESKVLDKVLEELREEDRHYAPEWRELGPDEVIQEGDECRYKGEAQYEPVMDSMIGGYSELFKFFRLRTRRPLCPNNAPKQEEMPLEKELDYLTCEASSAADIHNHVLIVDCLRYLCDDIQKLKEIIST